MIRGVASKRAWSSEIVTEGRVAKRAHTTEPMRIAPLPSADRGKKVVEQLSSALDNELLNVA